MITSTNHYINFPGVLLVCPYSLTCHRLGF